MYAWVQKHEKNANRPRPIRVIRLRGCCVSTGGNLLFGEARQCTASIVLLLDCGGGENGGDRLAVLKLAGTLRIGFCQTF